MLASAASISDTVHWFSSELSHRCRYGSNVHRIKNMFQQMQSTSPAAEADGEDAGRGADKAAAAAAAVRLSLPRAGSLNENVDHSALLKLGSTVSERVNKFDVKPENGQQGRASSPSYSKLQETRRIFEQQQQQQGSSSRVPLKADNKASSLSDMARFNGSTESLDSLDASEAVSPTVSQLSAVFERAAELRNNLHRLSSTPPLPCRGVSAKVGVLSSRVISKRPSALAASGQAAAPPRGRGTFPSQSVNGGQRPLVADTEKRVSDAGVEAKAQEVDEVKEEECRSNGEKSRQQEKEEEDRTQKGLCIMAEEEEQDKEQEEDDYEEEEEERYEPESSCVEIPGLPLEEEPPPSRKIRFSLEPIKVSPGPDVTFDLVS